MEIGFSVSESALRIVANRHWDSVFFGGRICRPAGFGAARIVADKLGVLLHPYPPPFIGWLGVADRAICQPE
jgi:hypothetical protein